MSYKTLIAAKNFGLTFNETDRFIREHDGTRYLVLFGKTLTFHNVIILVKSVF